METSALIEFMNKIAGQGRFETPFKQRGNYIATDAHVMLIVPCDKMELPFEEREKPNCDKLLLSNINSSITINVAEFRSFLESNCPMENEMLKYGDCTECNGDGKLECDLGHMHDCEKCDGEGAFYKPSGKKNFTPHKRFKFFGQNFYSKVLGELLASAELLGATEITSMFIGNTTFAAQYWKVGDCTFLIMPCRVETWEEKEVVEMTLKQTA